MKDIITNNITNTMKNAGKDATRKFEVRGAILIGLLLIIAFCAVPAVSAGAYTGDATQLWEFKKNTNFIDTDISHDDTFVVTGGVIPKVYLLSTNGNSVWEADVDGAVNGVSVATAGMYTAAGTKKGGLYLFDRNGATLWKLTLGNNVYDVALSSGGTYLVAGSDDGCIYLYKNSGEQVWKKKINGNIYGVSISDDGSIIAVGKREFEVGAYDLQGNRLWSKKTPEQVLDVDVSPDGSVIVAGCSDGRVYVYDREGNLVWSYNIRMPVNGVSASIYGSYIAAASDDTYTHILSEKTRAEILKVPSLAKVRGAALTVTGTNLAAASDDGTLKYYALPITYTPAPEATPEVQYPNQPTVPATAASAVLEISSAPSGALAYVDNVYKGTTPVIVTELTAGTHSVTVSLDGYSSYSTQVELSAGRTTSVSASLAPTAKTSPVTVVTVIAAAIGALLIFAVGRRDD